MPGVWFASNNRRRCWIYNACMDSNTEQIKPPNKKKFKMSERHVEAYNKVIVVHEYKKFNRVTKENRNILTSKN